MVATGKYVNELSQGPIMGSDFQTIAGATLSTALQNTAAGSLTFAEASNIAFGTSTGTKIGTATSQKIGFFNATPIVQEANTVSLETVLSDFGFRASGAGAPLAIGALTIADGSNVVLGTTTGTVIGTVGGGSGQKLAFFGATPAVQPVLATGAGKTADNIITFLQTIGLCRQS